MPLPSEPLIPDYSSTLAGDATWLRDCSTDTTHASRWVDAPRMNRIADILTSLSTRTEQTSAPVTDYEDLSADSLRLHMRSALDLLDPDGDYSRTPLERLHDLAAAHHIGFPMVVISSRDSQQDQDGWETHPFTFESTICADNETLVECLARLQLRDFDIGDADEVKVFRLAARPRKAKDGELCEQRDEGWLSDAVGCGEELADLQAEVRGKASSLTAKSKKAKAIAAQRARIDTIEESARIERDKLQALLSEEGSP